MAQVPDEEKVTTSRSNAPSAPSIPPTPTLTSIKWTDVVDTVEEHNELKAEDWDSEQQKLKFANTAEDLLRNMHQFSVCGKWVDVRPNDSYVPVLYKGKRCIFETPVSSCLFGLEPYTNPDSKIKKYSLNFCLRTDGRKDMEDFTLFLRRLDEFAQGYQYDPKDKYYSAVQVQKRNKTPTLRIKVPSYKKQLNVKLILSQNKEELMELKYPTVDEFNHYITFDTKISCMLLINNIWRAAGKFGISFKLLKLRVIEDPEDVEFRD